MDPLSRQYRSFLHSHASNRYSELDQESHEILAFKIQPGLGTHLYKTLHPWIQTTCTLSPSQQASAGIVTSSSHTTHPSFFLFGKLFQNLNVESLLAFKSSPRTLWMVSGLYSMKHVSPCNAMY